MRRKKKHQLINDIDKIKKKNNLFFFVFVEFITCLFFSCY